MALPTASLHADHGVSSAVHKWKAKFGGLDVSEARRLKALEENGRLKRMRTAEAMLDNAALKRICWEKVVTPAATEAARYLRLPDERAAGLPE